MATNDVSLRELFRAGWDIQKQIDSGKLVANSKDFNVMDEDHLTIQSFVNIK